MHEPRCGPDEAELGASELVRRYLYAYGPATPQHFAKWAAAQISWANALGN
ncbi:DNA glycosylase AlkZ-like family protein [Streptomyces sp. bgisy031]|uniref:DNA glycosylase AlkZ-like family protein n=1 Tax=Streptomyces sp. bgisy031 TaxID=3413772 RepID=UPI003D717302